MNGPSKRDGLVAFGMLDAVAASQIKSRRYAEVLLDFTPTFCIWLFHVQMVSNLHEKFETKPLRPFSRCEHKKTLINSNP